MRLKFITGKPLLKLNGEPLTKEEFNYLYIGSPEKNSFVTIAHIFDVEPVDVFLFANSIYRHPRMEDNYWMRVVYEMEEEAYKKHQETRERERVISPKARRSGYEEPVNPIKAVHLSAMRMHRGYNMHGFSEISGLSYGQIKHFEKARGAIIPEFVSDTYFRVLNITKSEFKRILQCLSGDRKDMFEEINREIPDEVKMQVWIRDKKKCVKCGSRKHLHLHHIIHYSKGGRHVAENLTTLCVSCHAEVHRGERGYGLLRAQVEKLLGGKLNV